MEVDVVRLWPLLFVACSPVVFDAPAPIVDGCDASVDGVHGTDGSWPVTPSDGVRVTLDMPLAPEQLTLSMVGVTGAMELSGRGDSAVFYPDEPLAAGATYHLVVDICDARQMVPVETAELPNDSSSRETPTQRVWALRLSQLQWIEPPGFQHWLSGPADRELALVHAAPDRPLKAALLVRDGQDTARCGQVETIGTEAAGGSGFVASATALRLGRADHALSMEHLHIDGQEGYARSLRSGSLTGLLDLRALGLQDRDLCASAPCMPCEDGASCLLIEANIPPQPLLDFDPADLPDVCP